MTDVTIQQIQTALKQPAIFSNKFYFTHLGQAVRIAYCEEIMQEDSPLHHEEARVTVVLPVDQFVKFAGEIMKLVDMVQEKKPE